MTELDALLTYCRTLPAGSVVPVNVATIVELAERQSVVPGAEALLTTADIAERYHVSHALARSWLAAGRIPGAQRLGKLGWRAPVSGLPALETFLSRTDATDLAAWRGKAA